jgi:hypothetical protein
MLLFNLEFRKVSLGNYTFILELTLFNLAFGAASL